MPFDPQNFITISKELQNGTTEAHYRSIINRAYYGAYGHIRNKLQIYSTGQSSHQVVIDALKYSTSITKKKAGKRLETLFKKRKEADYNHTATIIANDCAFCIKDAEETIKLFETKD